MTFTGTTSDGKPFTTNKPKEVQFISGMEAAGIPWRLYSGRNMFGRECPAVSVQPGGEFTAEDVIRATTVSGLKTDSLGKGSILYTG
jgi:hypothetical protein